MWCSCPYASLVLVIKWVTQNSVHTRVDSENHHTHQAKTSVRCAGTAVAAAPSKSMLDLSEDCDAKSALVQTQGCVGAYDKMPLASASCLFTMDTSSDIFIMHSFQVSIIHKAKDLLLTEEI